MTQWRGHNLGTMGCSLGYRIYNTHHTLTHLIKFQFLHMIVNFVSFCTVNSNPHCKVNTLCKTWLFLWSTKRKMTNSPIFFLHLFEINNLKNCIYLLRLIFRQPETLSSHCYSTLALLRTPLLYPLIMQ